MKIMGSLANTKRKSIDLGNNITTIFTWDYQEFGSNKRSSPLSSEYQTPIPPPTSDHSAIKHMSQIKSIISFYSSGIYRMLFEQQNFSSQPEINYR
jgi:hypothetical protein